METNRNNQNNNPKNNEKKPKGSIWVTLIITVVLILLINAVFNAVRNSQYTRTTLSDFLDAKENSQLTEVELQYDRILYLTKEEAAKPAVEQKAFFTGIPLGSDLYSLAVELRAAGVKVSYPIVEDNSTIMMILSFYAHPPSLSFKRKGRFI